MIAAKKTPFTEEELRLRAYRRVAVVLEGCFEENRPPHSRLFDTLVHTRVVSLGESPEGGEWTEHVVPCARIRAEAFLMFGSGRSVDDVAAMIGRLLRTARISRGQRVRLDFDKKLKLDMPDGWKAEDGCVRARLCAAGISLLPPSGDEGGPPDCASCPMKVADKP